MRASALTVLAAALILGGIAPIQARSIPDPRQRPAPGNEAPQVPISKANYTPATNWQLQCVGCHLPDGEGSRRGDTPRMKDFVGHFLKVEGGREFLVRVPGASQSALSDAQLADLLNWLLREDGMAGPSMPARHRPYTGEEIAAIRRNTILNLPGTRAGLIEQMRGLGIVINDGMVGD